MKRLVALFLLGGLPCLLLPKPVLGGVCLYPTSGYMLSLGGNTEKLQDAPAFGARLEYNFSRHDVFAMGVVYSFSRHDFQSLPPRFQMDQHFCLLGYRFGKNWEWVNFGSQMGMGAVVMDSKGSSVEGTKVDYALQFGLTLSFRPMPWLHVGPDANFMMTTDVEQWIFGGRSSYFLNLGGHVAFCF